MQFIRTATAATGGEALTARLQSELQSGKPVLWLVCGGSNIALEADVMRRLPEADTKHLTVMLTDERYGPVGHKDSNATQLYAAGFEPKSARFITVLEDKPLEATRARYAATAARELTRAEVIIAQFGIGPDGHIAGILPHSPAVTTDSWAAAYEAPPFTRLTLTPRALRSVTTAYAFAFGDAKKQALTQLKDAQLPLADQPSQILKELSAAYVYNDQVEGSA